MSSSPKVLTAIQEYKWHGLPAIRKRIPLLEASQEIPAFARRPFRLASAATANAANPFYDTIVRLPTEEDPTEVPVGVVSRSYKLVQHS
jgi:hypothetical protein